MKKVIIAFIIVLTAIYVTLSLISSKSEYEAERQFYKASKKYKKIRINPDVAPPKLVASLEKDLQKIIEKYPDTKTVEVAYITLAEVYINDKKYDSAIELLNEFIAKHDKEIVTLSRAHFLKGIAYEKQDKWDKALKEFEILKDKYVNTPLGLQAPLYIAQYYKTKEKFAEAKEQFEKTVMFYQKLEKENKGTLIGYSASNLLVQALINLENYEEAGKVVEETIFNYPIMITLAQQLPYVELIYIKTLKRPDKAVEIYTRILEKTKDDKLKRFLESKIQKLQED